MSGWGEVMGKDEIKAVANATEESAKTLRECLPLLEKLATFISGGIYSISPGLWNFFSFRSFKGALDLVEEATAEVEKRGISKDSMRKIPHKLARQIINEAAFEDDPEIKKMWKNLIANWFNPNYDADEILPAFTSIIKELSPLDARILYDFDLKNNVGSSQEMLFPGMFASKLDVPVSLITISLRNLERLSLIENIEDLSKRIYAAQSPEMSKILQEHLGPALATPKDEPKINKSARERVYLLTQFGLAFIKACSN